MWICQWTVRALLCIQQCNVYTMQISILAHPKIITQITYFSSHKVPTEFLSQYLTNTIFMNSTRVLKLSTPFEYTKGSLWRHDLQMILNNPKIINIMRGQSLWKNATEFTSTSNHGSRQEKWFHYTLEMNWNGTMKPRVEHSWMQCFITKHKNTSENYMQEVSNTISTLLIIFMCLTIFNIYNFH